MGKITVLTTPSGDQMAVLPLADYQMLLAAAEDAEDVRLYDAAKRRFAAGEDEAVPAAFAKRLIAGENPVRVWRELRGLTAKDLARKSGIKGPYLSQIETGKREGTLAVMGAIARALHVALDDLALGR